MCYLLSPMTLSTFLSKPALRLPLLIAAVIATVATSPPSWQMADRTEKRPVHVDAGATAEARVELVASHAVAATITLEGLVAREGTLRIEAVDSRADCHSDATYESDDGIWRLVPKTGSERPGSQLHRIDFAPACSSTESRATLTFRFVNQGPTPLDFEWHATASIGGEDDDEAPDGAFVDVKVLP